MKDRELQRWIDLWANQYRPEWDGKIGSLVGKDAFSHADVACIYEWKFRRMWPRRKIDRMKEFPEKHVLALSRRAFRCTDELGALMILTLIPGAAAAGASALLMTHDPARYTVMDVRAVRSLNALKMWPEERGTRASCLWWPEYLRTCREIASRTERSLRTVDHALWAANGRNKPPPP